MLGRGKDIADPGTLVAVANQAGFDGEALVEQAGSNAIADAANALTQEAITNQIFRAPTYVINSEPFGVRIGWNLYLVPLLAKSRHILWRGLYDR